MKEHEQTCHVWNNISYLEDKGFWDYSSDSLKNTQTYTISNLAPELLFQIRIISSSGGCSVAAEKL